MPDIFINTQRPVDRSIVAGINQPQREAPIGAYVAGSTYDTNLYFVLNDGTYDAASGQAGQDVQVAISTISEPESGDFTLSDGTVTTTAITYGASAQTVEDALNALNTDTGPLGSLVDVVKQSNTQYTVTFRTLGAQTALSGSTVSLYPESTPTGSIAVTGDASTYAQQVIELTRQPAIYQQTWSTITNGFNGELALNTTRLLQSLVLEAGQPFYIEIKLNGETVAREVVGMEHSTMPASAFSGAAITNLLDAFAADPTSNANFNAAAWAAEIAAGGTVTSVNGEVGVVVLDMDDFAETATNKILTAAERTKLGDQVLTDVIDKMAWNATDLTFDIDTGANVVIQVGQELLVKAVNKTGVTLSNGAVVKIDGAQGSRPTISLAQADSLANINGVIGIVTADILNNADGFVTVHGLVRGLDTSTFTEGDELFLSSSVAGGITNVEPTLSIPVGTATFSNAGSGTIFANVDNQKHLLEFASDPTLVGSFSAASWKTALAIAAADVDFGTGTDSYVWTSDGAGGAAWEALTGGGDLLAANNLSDVANAATSLSNLGGLASTDIDTLSKINTIITDATLIDTTDARLSDARTPTAHAASHTDGTDDIQDATNAVKGLATAAQITALEANTAASHAAATSSGTGTYVTLTGQDIVVDPIDITDITDNVALSTGVLTGGVLSTGAGASQYSISDGTGIIVDETGAITEVSWTGKSNITPTNIATSLLTWVSIDNAGNVVEMTSPCSPATRRAEICLGVVVHVNLTTVDAVNNEQVVAFNPGATAYDLADALGFINVSGNVYSANGANLNLNKSVGEIFATGSNYDSTPTNPHIKELAVLSALTFQYRYSDGSNGVTGTAITPDVLDDGAGGTTAVTNNRWSVQRIYSFVSNNVKIQLGVEDFASKAAAIAGIASEAYITEPSLAANGLLRGWLVVKKGTTDLSDTTQAQFIAAGKLGEVGSAGGGGVGNVVAELGIAVSDETTALTTGTAKGTFRMPYAMTVTDVRATVTTAPTGANIIVDINDGGTSIMTTNKLSIDATEKTSTTAATAPGVTDTALADDAEITIDIDQIGSTIAGAGLKIWVIGTRA